MEHALRFRGMGTHVHLVVVDGDADLLERARARIDDLEQRWSRFLPHSEISELNRAAGSGEPTLVSAVTFDLLVDAVEAWRATNGVFDPTVLPALVAAGYDRSFDEGQGPIRPAPALSTRCSCDEIVLDHVAGAAALPAGCGLDLGGIGKGRAADLVVDELMQDGDLAGACVNLGGDLRVFGRAPDGATAWAVGLEAPDDRDTVTTTVGLADGALATSSTARRRWRGDDGESRHHLIDPRTNAPAITRAQSVSVIAATATEAEIHAKASLITGEPSTDAMPMQFVRDDGTSESFNHFEDYIW